MAKTVRLLGRPPQNGSIKFRERYLENDRDISFFMKQPGDFYTGIFAWGGRGQNTVELPYSSKDINFSSLTIFGNASLQFSTNTGDAQTIHLNGVRRVNLLDADLNIARTYRRAFGTRLPRLPQASSIRWKTSKLWNGETPDDTVDTITGSRRSNNNFYLSQANTDTTVIGRRSNDITDTLFIDEYLSDDNVKFFARNGGRANIRIADVGNDRQAVFKTRRMENIVFRDALFVRAGSAWLEIKNPSDNPFGGSEAKPINEPSVVPPQDSDSVFEPLPDIFNSTSTTQPF